MMFCRDFGQVWRKERCYSLKTFNDDDDDSFICRYDTELRLADAENYVVSIGGNPCLLLT